MKSILKNHYKRWLIMRGSGYLHAGEGGMGWSGGEGNIRPFREGWVALRK